MKRCTKCGIEKDECEFSKSQSRKDGLQSWCKLCQNECNRNDCYKRRQRCFKLFSLKCERCGETDIDTLSLNHVQPPKSDVYKGLHRSGDTLYRQILKKPELTKFFTLLCMTCNKIDYYEKSGYYNEHTAYSTLQYRKKKEKICGLWNHKCFHCFRTFPIELLSINHTNGNGTKEIKERTHNYMGSLFNVIPTNELISRIDSGELEITCFNCNCSRTESSKWIKQAKSQKKSFK